MKFETHRSWALALTCMTEGLSLLLMMMTILLMLRLLPLSNTPSGYSEFYISLSLSVVVSEVSRHTSLSGSCCLL